MQKDLNTRKVVYGLKGMLFYLFLGGLIQFTVQDRSTSVILFGLCLLCQLLRSYEHWTVCPCFSNLYQITIIRPETSFQEITRADKIRSVNLI